MAERLTEELLDELADAPSLDSYVSNHEFSNRTLASYLQELLEQKHLERVRVVRMADLNETFGYQIFKGTRHPSRNKVLQIAFAMALTLRETNRDWRDAVRLRGSHGAFARMCMRDISPAVPRRGCS